MAIPSKSKYIIIPIQEGWSNFSIEQRGKDVHLKGYDGKTNDWFHDEPEMVYLEHFEQSNKEIWFCETFDEGFGDSGEKYLIIKRTPYDILEETETKE